MTAQPKPLPPRFGPSPLYAAHLQWALLAPLRQWQQRSLQDFFPRLPLTEDQADELPRLDDPAETPPHDP